MNKGSNQEHNLLEIKVPENAADIFLQLFLPVTLAKRLVAIILLAVGMPVRDAVKLTGLCERSMWTLKRQLREQSVPGLMVIRSGSGHKGKTADIEEQRDFFDTVLDPLMKKAEGGEISLPFLDASHFVMGYDFLGHIYGRARRYIKTFSGRRRYNVLGALECVSKKYLLLSIQDLRIDMT